jgi:hypothetical protein
MFPSLIYSIEYIGDHIRLYILIQLIMAINGFLWKYAVNKFITWGGSYMFYNLHNIYIIFNIISQTDLNFIFLGDLK